MGWWYLQETSMLKSVGALGSRLLGGGGLTVWGLFWAFLALFGPLWRSGVRNLLVKSVLLSYADPTTKLESEFVKGFSCNLGGCSIMQAKLWGIIKGLQIAVANDVQNYSILVQLSLKTLSFWSVESHSLKTNSVVNLLAKKGQELPYVLHLFDTPSHNTLQAISFDAFGSSN
ncbi:hypothetical protein Ahy_B08g092806 [Arachis hypogaea]|uniref:RNase H type-1 domain-containing protein n=1 Tax=Arachis hypogaea TaxID=3818 RepID=A0A444Y4P3_ARAHY|nr:hypothetical protein Ahy_B08g092806 [Arachis hypogaea]